MNKKEGITKIFNDYVEKGGCVMDLIPKIEALYNDDDITFKITNIIKEKTMFGSTTIEAECVQDGVTVIVTMPYDVANDNKKIKEVLKQAYMAKPKLTEQETLNVGDIL